MSIDPTSDKSTGRASDSPNNEDSIDNIGDPDADGQFQREVSDDEQDDEK